MDKRFKEPTKKKLHTNKPKTSNASRNSENYGNKFVSDHYDAEIEFYWAIKVTVEVPKNKVLTGMAQQIQRDLTGQIYVGIFRKGDFDYSHRYANFQDICSRSLSEAIIVDQFGTTYTGKQFLDIVLASNNY